MYHAIYGEKREALFYCYKKINYKYILVIYIHHIYYFSKNIYLSKKLGKVLTKPNMNTLFNLSPGNTFVLQIYKIFFINSAV